MPVQSQRYYSPEDYLAQEEAAEYKHEYRNGEIVPMTEQRITIRLLGISMLTANLLCGGKIMKFILETCACGFLAIVSLAILM